jgi:hypothetical protein
MYAKPEGPSPGPRIEPLEDVVKVCSEANGWLFRGRNLDQR